MRHHAGQQLLLELHMGRGRRGRGKSLAPVRKETKKSTEQVVVKANRLVPVTKYKPIEINILVRPTKVYLNVHFNE